MLRCIKVYSIMHGLCVTWEITAAMSLVNIYHLTSLRIFFLVRTFRVLSLSNCPIHTTVLTIILTVLPSHPRGLLSSDWKPPAQPPPPKASPPHSQEVRCWPGGPLQPLLLRDVCVV